MAKGKGGSQQPTGQTTTTTNQQPWAPQQPYLQNALSQADYLYNNYSPQYFPGQTYVPQTPAQTQGNQALNAIGQIYLPQAAGNAQNTSDYLQSGKVISNDPSYPILWDRATQNAGALGTNLGADTLGYFSSGAATNPFLNSVAQSTLASVLPSIQSQFINGGSLSSPQAAYASSQGAAAALAPILSNSFLQQQQNQLGAAGQLAGNYLTGQGQSINAAQGLGTQYGNDVQKMVQGLALAPQTMQTMLMGPQAQLAAGQNLQNWDQAGINDAIQRWNYNTTLPYQQLNQYIGQVSGNYGGTGQTMNPYYTNTGASALSGGLGGALLGGTLGGAFPETIGSGLGAGLGGGLGLLMGLI